MANVEDRPRLPYGARDRRSVGLLVLLFLAVFAAIFFIRNIASRHHEPAATTPVASAAAPPATPPAGEVEQTAATAPPAASADDEPAMSARKQSEIARAISEGRPALTVCYQRALVRDETLVNGNLKVRLSVAPSGRVGAVNISGPAAFRALDPCLKAAVSKWTFPTASAPYVAEFPLELRGAQ
jgi:outer membrane biosynthesis protein TonB